MAIKYLSSKSALTFIDNGKILMISVTDKDYNDIFANKENFKTLDDVRKPKRTFYPLNDDLKFSFADESVLFEGSKGIVNIQNKDMHDFISEFVNDMKDDNIEKGLTNIAALITNILEIKDAGVREAEINALHKVLEENGKDFITSGISNDGAIFYEKIVPLYKYLIKKLNVEDYAHNEDKNYLTPVTVICKSYPGKCEEYTDFYVSDEYRNDPTEFIRLFTEYAKYDKETSKFIIKDEPLFEDEVVSLFQNTGIYDNDLLSTMIIGFGTKDIFNEIMEKYFL